jgi:hypothetical protein
MTETERHEPQIYQLGAVLRGISPLLWRRLLVRSDTTVAQLHEVLQIAFGWDDEHLNRFEIRSRECAVYRDGGGVIGIDARGVRLDGLKLRRLERFGTSMTLAIAGSTICDWRRPCRSTRVRFTPVCVAGKCSAPPEDCGELHAFKANRQY